MAVVLGTTLKVGSGSEEEKPKTKVIEEGTPLSKLTKAERELAKELGLLVSVPDDPEEALEEGLRHEEEQTALTGTPEEVDEQVKEETKKEK